MRNSLFKRNKHMKNINSYTPHKPPWGLFVVSVDKNPERGKKKNVFVYQTENKLLRHSGGVHLAGHLQTVETLHVADGFGQDLRRLHGGHLSAGLGQVAEPTEPRLGGDKHTCV